MRRKAVKRRLKLLGSLRSKLLRQRRRLRPTSAARPPAPADFSHGPHFDSWDADLAGLEQDLTTIENRYQSARDRIAGFRRQRDRALSALYRRQCRTRQLLRELLGVHELGAGTPPKPARELAREVLRTVDFLRRFEGPAPQPIAGDTFDARALAAELDGDLEHLLAASEQLIKAIEAAITARRRADDLGTEVDRALPEISGELKSLCRVAAFPGPRPDAQGSQLLQVPLAQLGFARHQRFRADKPPVEKCAVTRHELRILRCLVDLLRRILAQVVELDKIRVQIGDELPFAITDRCHRSATPPTGNHRVSRVGKGRAWALVS